MVLEVLADADAVARRGAEIIADDARRTVDLRGRFVMAVSGGRTPWSMLRLLADMNLPWPDVYVTQVDERIAADGDPVRNFTHLAASLLARAPLAAEHVHAMSVTAADLDAATVAYADILHALCGVPPVLDLVHLGLGSDGHAASLLPGDGVLEASSEVALSSPYQGLRRMTLTYPVINRARRILWLVAGAEKAAVLARLMAGDRSIPAGRVERQHALVLADAAAAGR
jgi:6-phosphogluconolactonase